MMRKSPCNIGWRITDSVVSLSTKSQTPDHTYAVLDYLLSTVSRTYKNV